MISHLTHPLCLVNERNCMMFGMIGFGSQHLVAVDPKISGPLFPVFAAAETGPELLKSPAPAAGVSADRNAGKLNLFDQKVIAGHANAKECKLGDAS